MNERIKELAEQAGFDIEEGGHIMLHHVYLTNRMEKFAELIVRECAYIANTNDSNLSLIVDSIRMHF